MSLSDIDPGPSNDGRMDHTDNNEDDSTAGVYDEDNDGRSNASENESQDHSTEGYTPLNFNMNELVLMDEADSNDSDDDHSSGIDGGMNDGELLANGHYQVIGAPAWRLNGVKDGVMLGHPTPRARDGDGASIRAGAGSDGGDNGGRDPAHGIAGEDPPGSVDAQIDFHLLADRALRGLEVELLSTLGRSAGADENADAETPRSTEFLDDIGEGATVHIDGRVISDSDVESTDSAAPAAAAAPTEETIPAISDPVDVGAIQKALQSIRLKSPQLATNLDAGASSSFLASAAHAATCAALNSVVDDTARAIEHSRQQRYLSHGIIPAVPLAAFRRATLKSQAASANLTRSVSQELILDQV